MTCCVHSKSCLIGVSSAVTVNIWQHTPASMEGPRLIHVTKSRYGCLSCCKDEWLKRMMANDLREYAYILDFCNRGFGFIF